MHILSNLKKLFSWIRVPISMDFSLFPWIVVIDCGIILDITFIVIIIIIGRVGTSIPSCTTGPH